MIKVTNRLGRSGTLRLEPLSHDRGNLSSRVGLCRSEGSLMRYWTAALKGFHSSSTAK